MNKDDEILLNSIDSKLRQCTDQYCVTHTSFLDPRQCSLAESTFAHTRHLLYGGYGDAERRIMVFLPDYIDLPGGKPGFSGSLPLDEEDDPLCILRASVPRGSTPLTHRDYLGALLGLGVDRSISGDILVRKDGADLIVLKSMSEFLLMNYTQAGRASLTCSLLPLSALDPGEVHTREKRDTLASLRLDNLVSSAFDLSRTKAQEAIAGGIVLLDGLQVLKPDATVQEGCRVVLRGKGKAVLKEVGKTTRKDRIAVIVEVYV